MNFGISRPERRKIPVNFPGEFWQGVSCANKRYLPCKYGGITSLWPGPAPRQQPYSCLRIAIIAKFNLLLLCFNQP